MKLMKIVEEKPINSAEKIVKCSCAYSIGIPVDEFIRYLTERYDKLSESEKVTAVTYCYGGDIMGMEWFSEIKQ